ncbi:uncharacterized protein KQ657_000437 [Scheffersomyces spartinae]|uniref:GYF domain-containing protein n=1 Tax=Scheffersomyces spartinae TaxID=45513 RepID=A0A9P7V9G3_9ASCO|nr:uncharacterized protein KQ657_000437 [Scheffersomyces spartinae]KAG7193746.1 hypothetical protein KQ657_000437 [Scheffersomyces spartinae]
MSQTSWSRKPSETPINDPFATAVNIKTSEQQGLQHANVHAPRMMSSSTTAPASASTGGAPAISTWIPVNKGSKRYQLDSVFKVWFDNQQKIEHQVFNKNDDNYKLDTPGHIYHLELQKSSIPKSEMNTNDQITDLTAAIKNVNVSELVSVVNPKEEILPSGSTPPTQVPAGVPSATEGTAFGCPESTPPQLVQSDKIEWVYVDPSGNEQGPFIGDIMQEWLTAGYLNMDLKIRRKEESAYYSLREYCDRVSNYVQPFKIPLIDLNIVPPPPNLPPTESHYNIGKSNEKMAKLDNSQLPQQFSANHTPLHDVLSQQQPPPQPQQQPQPGQLSQFFLPNNGGALGGSNMRLNALNPQGNLFSPDFINSDPFNKATIPQQPATSFSNQFGYDHMGSGFGVNNLSHTSLSHINSMPSLLQQQIHQQQPVLSRTNSGWSMDLNNANGTPVAVTSSLNQVNQPAPLSPWLSGVQSLSRVGSPFVPTLALRDDHVLNIHQSVVSDILGNVDESTNPVAPPISNNQTAPTLPSQPSQVIELGPPEPSIIEKIVSPSQVDEQAVNEAKANQKEKKEASQKKRSSSINAPVPTEKLNEVPSLTQTNTAATLPEDNVAVIIDKSQSNDALKAATPTQPKLAPWAKVTTKASEPLTLKEIQRLEAEKLEKQKQELKTEQPKMWQLEEKLDDIASNVPLGWATANVSKPTKTLAEIQKEEADAKAKALKASAGTSSSTSSTPLMNKTSLASTLAAVPKDDGGAWTTISKKQPVKKPSMTSLYNSQPTTKINPQMLRSASANKTITTNNTNTVSIKEEFLIWARSAMTNLYPTANRDEMLDLFVALPSGSESSQLIADTIYSSSATMDGRRYAQEFLKRRQKVESQIGSSDDYSWTDAIILSADKVSSVDEDGWSTSIKKKGGRRK